MRRLIALLATDLTVSLAVLLVLGGALLLPLTRAETAVSNVTLTVLNPDGSVPGESTGGGGGTSTAPTPSTPAPITPIPTPIVVPPTVDPVNFTFLEYIPRIIRPLRASKIAFYGYNFPAKMQIRVTSKDASYVANIDHKKVLAQTLHGKAEKVEHTFPAFSLPRGHVFVRLFTQEGVPLTENLPIWVISIADLVEPTIAPVSYPKNLVMTSGSETTVKIVFKNQSSVTIDKYFQPIVLGTAQPYDRTSVFLSNRWSYSNRVVELPKAPIGAFEEFTVELPLKAPNVSRRTQYKESFALVVEGLAWIKSSNTPITITVNPTPVIKQGDTSVAQPPTQPRKTILETIRDIVSPPAKANTPANPPKTVAPFETPRVTLDKNRPSITTMLTRVINWFKR